MNLTLRENTIYTVLLCLYVADPATFLAPNSILGPSLALRIAYLLTRGKKIHSTEFVLLPH